MLRKLLCTSFICMILLGCLPNQIVSLASDASSIINETVISAEQENETLVQFNQSADAVYRYALEGDLPKVRGELTRLEQLVKRIHLGKLTTVEGVKAISDSVVETKRAVNAVRIDMDRWLVVTAKLRLAADALNHPQQPMWLQYYKVFSDDLNQMEQGLAQKQDAKTKSAYNSFLQHYRIIRPAAIIQRSPEAIERFDSYLTFLRKKVASNPIVKSETEDAVNLGRELVQEMFLKKKDTPTFVPISGGDDPWIWTIGIGAVVISVLSYVGYRKYQYEKLLELQRKLRSEPESNFKNNIKK